MRLAKNDIPPPDGGEARRPPRMRAAERGDLAAINALIAGAVDTWKLSPRVRRASIPLYQYQPVDLDFLSMRVALDDGGRIVGVAAWEAADARDAPPGSHAVLLHGIHVEPGRMRRGVGSRLLAAVAGAARDAGYDGLLVRAQADAIGFFESRGLERLEATDPLRDYPHRYWLDLRRGDARSAACSSR